MLEIFRKNNGAVSVFLTLILIPTLLFAGVVVDGVRIYGSKNMISGAGDLAMNGALAGYDGSLNDAYGLIAMSETPEELNEKLEEYFEATLTANGLTPQDFSKALINLELLEGSFRAESVESTEIYRTEVMKQEILEYMKYRAPVTFVNREILGRLDQFKGIDKEKEAVDSQVEFESELSDLQDKFDELLELVEQHTDVYRNIPSTAEISRQMQKTKDNYTRMCLLAVGYNRLTNYSEAESGGLLGLVEKYNNAAGGCAAGIDGFGSLLNMKRIENGIDNPHSLLNDLDPESEEYEEISSELAEFDANTEMWAEYTGQIYEEYETLSYETISQMERIYSYASTGYQSAADIEIKVGEMKQELEKCSHLFEDWKAAISDLPDSSDAKGEMSEQAKKYAPFFSKDNTGEFTKRIENNKQYYKQVKEQLEEMLFAGKQVVESEPKAVIGPLAAGAAASVNSRAELNERAVLLFQENWSGPYQLVTQLEKQDIETTDFVKYLREELCKPDDNSDQTKSKEKEKEWDKNLGACLKEYKTLFLTDDIPKVNIQDRGKKDLPTNWLEAAAAEGGAASANLEGGMKGKKQRKSISNSARNAMNTNNFYLSALSGLAEAVQKGAESVYMTEYVMGMLSYYTVDLDGEGNRIENPLSLSNDSLKKHQMYRAEVEYVIWGDPDVRDNVTKTKAMIFAIQFVCNSIFAFTNHELTSDAAFISNLFPLGFLGRSAIKAALLAVVSLIETTQDLNQLVKGEAVDLKKSKNNWETWILTRGSSGSKKHGMTAMRYEDYLWLMTCIQLLNPAKQADILARAADCIELNQTNGKENAENTLKTRFTMVKLSADVRTDTFFLQKAGEQNGRSIDRNTFVIHYKGVQGY